MDVGAAADPDIDSIFGSVALDGSRHFVRRASPARHVGIRGIYVVQKSLRIHRRKELVASPGTAARVVPVVPRATARRGPSGAGGETRIAAGRCQDLF